ncbi:MAG: hypothetical protein Q8O48_09025 [Anaerolineales bacterium]|nr:hypothetical protein [Anaerolineales bacterium]
MKKANTFQLVEKSSRLTRPRRDWARSTSVQGEMDEKLREWERAQG